MECLGGVTDMSRMFYVPAQEARFPGSGHSAACSRLQAWVLRLDDPQMTSRTHTGSSGRRPPRGDAQEGDRGGEAARAQERNLLFLAQAALM